MEIGPIAGIPLITTVKPSSAVPDASRVFAVEFRKQAGEGRAASTLDRTPWVRFQGCVAVVLGEH